MITVKPNSAGKFRLWRWGLVRTPTGKAALYPILTVFLVLTTFLGPLRGQEARTALVVGCDYHGSSLELPSPLRDAQSLATVLKDQLGFEVTLLPNPSRKALLDGIDRFGTVLGQRGGVGLFYFSGHGSQTDGENYLIPTGAALGYREDLPTEAVAAQRIVTRMEAAGNRVNLLFLDACRNNPLPSSKQKALAPKGLAEIKAANGMLVGFATARDTVANDGGAGSLYTNALLRHIATPGLSVTDMLTRVNAEVRKTSGGGQVPFMEVGLSDVFTFVPGNAPPAEVARLEPMKPGPLAVTTPKPADPVNPVNKAVVVATKDRPFVNLLGMKFVPAPSAKVLFSVWDTRIQDYLVFVYANKWIWESPSFARGPTYPASNVSRDDARAFCRWLTLKERAEGKIGAVDYYRLPRSDEWSEAVGAAKYPWGGQWPPPKNVGNYSGILQVDSYGNTSPVGSFPANRFGLYDMGGNVWQWCEDAENTSGENGILRGASCNEAGRDELLSSAQHSPINPGSRGVSFGFRCVLEVAGK